MHIIEVRTCIELHAPLEVRTDDKEGEEVKKEDRVHPSGRWYKYKESLWKNRVWQTCQREMLGATALMNGVFLGLVRLLVGLDSFPPSVWSSALRKGFKYGQNIVPMSEYDEAALPPGCMQPTVLRS